MSAARNIFMRVALLGTIAVLGLASPASAEVDPAVTTRPTISSTPLPYVGNTLTASGGNTSPAGITTGYVWLRCESASESRCGMDDVIDGANASTYKLTSADLNQYIRVAKYACRYCPWDLAYQLSDPAKKVTAAPTPTPTPTRTPTPTPTPTKTPTPSPTPAKTPTPSPTPAKTPTPTPTPTRTPTPTPTKAPVVNVTPTPAPTEDVQIVDQISTGGFAVDAVAQPEPTPVATRGEVLAATESKRLKMLKPFPLVRISGVLTAGGAKISILTVRAPKGARIAVRCDGRGCPVRKVAQATKLVHIKQFERELVAGVKLTVSISKPGYFTKVTTITIRKGKAPLRSDQCQRPGTAKLSRCPRA